PEQCTLAAALEVSPAAAAKARRRRSIETLFRRVKCSRAYNDFMCGGKSWPAEIRVRAAPSSDFRSLSLFSESGVSCLPSVSIIKLLLPVCSLILATEPVKVDDNFSVVQFNLRRVSNPLLGDLLPLRIAVIVMRV